ncbi:MAG TPA: glycoside hydrolase family 32 protein [Verrucomicrobiales bacterium]|jgi:fructan beta-fructosidase|nr:glycoside hydrolase family 32 protein [Verrucomicrobiales bacterium]
MKSIRFAACFLAASSSLHAADPVVFADFEGTDYGAWKVTGKAFGNAPAKGTLPGQMHVEGFQGKGLVNSFTGGDDSTGRLTSPAFMIERKFITFLIGGGASAGETCLNLKVDGKVVRTATGPNAEPGGSERLGPLAWDVTEFAGKNTTLEIVDERKGGWGHINVDHIVFTDDRGSIALAAKVEPPQTLSRNVRVSGNFLQLPLMRKGNLQRLNIEADGKLLRYMHVTLPPAGAQSDFWYSADLREFKNRDVTLSYKSSDAAALEKLKFDDKEIIDPNAYSGPNRPQFHFSPRLGWMNDINGSYYQDGLYHIFYQFNPARTDRGAGFDMHWGHSVSRDLVHWEEWPVAIFPNAEGQCYSGTTVMQQSAIPGLNEGSKFPAPALFFAATTPFSQHVATSPDGGRSWKRFPGNPVVPNIGEADRDPKVIWHEASQHYIMVLYVGGPDAYHILRSKDLIKWEETSKIPNWFECPEFIPLKSAVTGEDLMLLYGCYRSPKGAAEPFSSNSCYQLGKFDGKTFTPVGKHRHAHRGPNYYAALVFMNAPKGRQIMMGWASGTSFPGEPFNQCASVPLHLQLKALNGEDTLCFEPVEEINALRGKSLVELQNASIADASAKLASLSKEVPLDVVVRFRPEATGTLNVTIRGITFSYDSATKTLKRGDKDKGVQLHPGDSLEARFLIDRGIVESFWNGGEAAYSIGSLHTHAGPAFEISGNTTLDVLSIYPMVNIWK